MVRANYLYQLILVAFLIFAMTSPVYSGGIMVETDTLRISGPPDRKFQPSDSISVDFRALDYAYGSREFEYLLVAIVPGEESLRHVTKENVEKWQFFYILLRDPRIKDASRNPSGEDSRFVFHLEFTAPITQGPYKLIYNFVPWFTQAPVNATDSLEILVPSSPSTNGKIRQQARKEAEGFSELAKFEVTLAAKSDETFTVYLKANGKNPAFAGITGGLSERPLEFSWSVGKEFKLPMSKVSYSYNLWPDDDKNWSAWTRDQAVMYHFVQKGVHTFSAKAMYKDGDRTIESPVAFFTFSINDHLVVKASREIIHKGPTAKQFNVAGNDVPSTIEFDSVYAKSKALIVGVWQFDDKHFSSFPEAKIKKDITTISDALKSNSFEVTTLFKDRLSRDEIATALENLVNEASKNDRLFVYFSSHGFSDKDMPTDAYIATSDCDMDKPSVRCMRLGDIELQARRAIDGKQVRQVFIAVDSCFAGLGTISKSAKKVNLAKLGAVQGIYMMTAGMADQLAEIDPALSMSTFTYYLSKGLKGDANVYDDDKSGIITLTELLLYVQYNVAQHTDSRQIPMLGRVKGSGEMLFRPMSP